MIESTLLVVCYAILIFISRHSIRSLHSHGLYRLISWMGLVGMFFLNRRSWFRDPLSVLQIVSWTALVFSVILLLTGLSGLRQMGKPDGSRMDDSLLGLEKTTKLVTGGIYRYIRHPMYSSLLFLGMGIYLKSPGLWSSLLFILVIAALQLTADIEEKENIRYFGEDYWMYIHRTKKFIPFVW